MYLLYESDRPYVARHEVRPSRGSGRSADQHRGRTDVGPAGPRRPILGGAGDHAFSDRRSSDQGPDERPTNSALVLPHPAAAASQSGYRRRSLAPPRSDRPAVVAHPDEVAIANGRRQDETQAIRVGRELHSRTELGTSRGVRAEVRVVVAHAQPSALPGDDQGLGRLPSTEAYDRDVPAPLAFRDVDPSLARRRSSTRLPCQTAMRP